MVAPLREAFDRLDDFLPVQYVGRARDHDELIDSVRCLQESVGLGDNERLLLRERISALERVTGPGGAATTLHTGEIAFGLIVGLMAAQCVGSEPSAAPTM